MADEAADMNSRGRMVRVAGFLLAAGSLVFLLDGSVASAQSAAGAPAAEPARNQLSLGMVFTCFMVMLGPMKIVGPFVSLTSDMDEAAGRRLALRAIIIACLGGLVAAVLGQKTLVSWGISISALHFAGGIILFLVALQNVLSMYGAPHETAAPPVYRNMAFSPLAFPTILTPYGLAVFMLLLAMTQDTYRELYICALFLAVMALNLVVMWFARAISRRGGGGLAIIGAVLGILQVALAIQMILTELRIMRVLPVS